eukprot:g10276.t1
MATDTTKGRGLFLSPPAPEILWQDNALAVTVGEHTLREIPTEDMRELITWGRVMKGISPGRAFRTARGEGAQNERAQLASGLRDLLLFRCGNRPNIVQEVWHRVLSHGIGVYFETGVVPDATSEDARRLRGVFDGEHQVTEDDTSDEEMTFNIYPAHINQALIAFIRVKERDWFDDSIKFDEEVGFHPSTFPKGRRHLTKAAAERVAARDAAAGSAVGGGSTAGPAPAAGGGPAAWGAFSVCQRTEGNGAPSVQEDQRKPAAEEEQPAGPSVMDISDDDDVVDASAQKKPAPKRKQSAKGGTSKEEYINEAKRRARSKSDGKGKGRRTYPKTERPKDDPSEQGLARYKAEMQGVASRVEQRVSLLQAQMFQAVQEVRKEQAARQSGGARGGGAGERGHPDQEAALQDAVAYAQRYGPATGQTAGGRGAGANPGQPQGHTTLFPPGGAAGGIPEGHINPQEPRGQQYQKALLGSLVGLLRQNGMTVSGPGSSNMSGAGVVSTAGHLHLGEAASAAASGGSAPTYGRVTAPVPSGSAASAPAHGGTGAMVPPVVPGGE